MNDEEHPCINRIIPGGISAEIPVIITEKVAEKNSEFLKENSRGIH